MHDQCRDDFYNREELDAEDDFLHEERTFNDRIRRALNAFVQEEPREHSAHPPQDEREVVDGHGLEADLEDEPENQNRDGRLDERPKNSEVRAEISLAEVAAGHLPEEFSVGNDVANQTD